MSDLVSRSSLLEAYDKAHVGPPGGARKLIEEAPAVDAVPVVHGRWETNNDPEEIVKDFSCSVCDELLCDFDTYALTPGENCFYYCPNCGSAMSLARMYNYKSPIETTMLQVKSDIEKSLEDTTYKAVIECGVAVDKDELIKALAYDRGQYEKGYGDGYRAAKDENVRCKDCMYSRPIDMEDDYEAVFGEDSVWCTHRDSGEYGLGFCYCGERDRA